MSQEKSGIQGFIEELRRRRVFRVAAVYLGAAFVLLEASEMIFPRLGLPDWTVTFILGTLALGFPIAVILAWAFEVTPEGMSRARKTDTKQTTAEKPLTGNSIITALLIVIVLLLLYPIIFSSSEESSTSFAHDPKSIAVLPFTSFSESKESEYFSDGMTDVILTQLAKIKDLKVISRTSIMQYKNTEKAIREIATELGVAHILEGSVQRAGDQVRIVSQLIKADSDEHLWAETYDRNYADIFDLQSDVARAIASAMKATLTPEEESYLNERPTDNQEAWDSYVQAKMLWDDFNFTTQADTLMMELFNKAADLDPKFLIPRAFLVRIHSNRYFNRIEPLQENLAQAKIRLAEVLATDSEAPEAHLAQGYYHYYASLEFNKALTEFTIAQSTQPNNADLYEALAYIHRRLGNWDQAYDSMVKSTDLDPNAGGKIGEMLGMSFAMRKWDRLEMGLNKLLLMNPHEEGLHSGQVLVTLLKTGSVERATRVVDSLSNIYSDDILRGAKENLAFFSRDFQTALDWARLDTSLQTKATFHRLLGNYDSAHVYYDSIRVRAERQLASNAPLARMYTELGYAHAGLGNREAAMEAIARAKRITSVETDAVSGANSLSQQARIYHLLGDKEQALEIYGKLLDIPSDLSIEFLLLDPEIDNLRDHPKYKELVRKHKPQNWSI